MLINYRLYVTPCMGCYIEFLILKEKILEIAGEEISISVTVQFCTPVVEENLLVIVLFEQFLYKRQP